MHPTEPESMTAPPETAPEETEPDRYAVFDCMSEDWGSEDVEGFVFYELPEEYQKTGYLPEKMQIYIRCLCKQYDVPYALVLAMIERESEQACEEIRYAAARGYEGCEVSTNGFDYPKGVTKYLSEELGYSAEYKSDRKIISVSW